MSRSAESIAKQLESSRNWKKRNRERHAELAKAYRERNPGKYKAQQRAAYAIRRGLLVRGNCEGCGTDQKVHAHHDDYSKPLQVRWLCYLCHKAEHPVSDEDKEVKFKEAKRARLFGEDNPNAALDNETVAVIRRALAAGLSQQKIADIVGVSQVTVSRIGLNRVYQVNDPCRTAPG
jgi:hypothetical protein